MKYLKSINEMVKNPDLVKLNIKQMFNKLNSLNIKTKTEYSVEEERCFFYVINKIPLKNLENTIKVLNNYRKIFSKLDYILSYNKTIFINNKYVEGDTWNSYHDYAFKNIKDILDKYEIENYSDNDYFNLSFIIKNSKTIRIKPKRYIYHYTKANKDDIMKKGLIPSNHRKSPDYVWEWELEYEDAIFAMNTSDKKWDGMTKLDCWKIDTLHLKNKWWVDLNIDKKDYIMTFEPIPPEFLTLL